MAARHVNSTAAYTATAGPASLNEVRAHVSGNESHMTESTGVNINKVAIDTADSVQDIGDDNHSLSGCTNKTCSETDCKSCEDPFDSITALFTDCDIVQILMLQCIT